MTGDRKVECNFFSFLSKFKALPFECGNDRYGESPPVEKLLIKKKEEITSHGWLFSRDELGRDKYVAVRSCSRNHIRRHIYNNSREKGEGAGWKASPRSKSVSAS